MIHHWLLESLPSTIALSRSSRLRVNVVDQRRGMISDQKRSDLRSCAAVVTKGQNVLSCTEAPLIAAVDFSRKMRCA
jgi:hypothetical protein